MSRPSLTGEIRAQVSRLGEMFGSSRRERLDASREDGREYPDPTPVEVPIGYQHPPTLREQMQMYIREELSAEAAELGLGTYEEESDFEPEDPDEIVMSGYEVHEFPFEPAPEDSHGPVDPPETEVHPEGALESEAPSGAVQEAPEGPNSEGNPGSPKEQ